MKRLYLLTVEVLSFELLSNHVHFVLQGTRQAARNFVVQFKHRYAMYYQKKYGVSHFLRRNKLDIREIPYNDEAPERAIAYVQMNCVAANICAHPSQYPWGTGSTFFAEGSQTGTRIGDLSARARHRLLHSTCDTIPAHWIMGGGGFILPSSYVNVKRVESLFRTPKRMNFFLANSSKAKKRIETSEAAMPAFRDQTILAALPDLCRSLFQRESFRHPPAKSAFFGSRWSEFCHPLAGSYTPCGGIRHGVLIYKVISGGSLIFVKE